MTVTAERYQWRILSEDTGTNMRTVLTYVGTIGVFYGGFTPGCRCSRGLKNGTANVINRAAGESVSAPHRRSGCFAKLLANSRCGISDLLNCGL